jgi:hypothetical protein
MQVYFDSSDAQLELEAYVTKSHSRADFSPAELQNGPIWRRILDIAGLTFVLLIACYLTVLQLASATIPESALKEKKISQAGFVIEIPKLEKPKPKPKPKPKVEPPKPKRVERLRSIPDNTLRTDRVIVSKESRDVKQETDRSVMQEKSEKRALPAVQTPVVEVETEALDRNEADEGLRYAAVSGQADTIGGFRNVVSSGTANREAPEEGISRIKLDPYHYQMVNVCLRLCVKSMFNRSGISKSERDAAEGWLKITRSGAEDFSVLFQDARYLLQR